MDIPLGGYDGFEARIDTAYWGITDSLSGSGAAAVASLGSPCKVSDTTTMGEVLGGYYPPQYCQKATMRVSLDVTLEDRTEGAFNIAIRAQTINGLSLGSPYLRNARSRGKLR